MASADLRLLSLRLLNFKGIRTFMLQPNGEDCTILGANEAGKTSLVDAYQWLLFGRDSQNRADFGIKTLDKENNAISGLDHEVEAAFNLGSGRQLILRRVFSEKWTKKRGSATATFTGHETTYYVDGVPCKEKEYQSRIAAIAFESVFRLLTDPTHFNRNLSWQDRRRILLEVCGDLTDEEVISSDASLSKLSKILQGRSMDDHRKVVQSQMSKINQNLREIPTRIDEANRALPDVSNVDGAALAEQIEDLSVQLAAKQEAYAQIASGGAVADAKVALRECEAEMQRLENEKTARDADRTREVNRQLTKAKGNAESLSGEIESGKRRMDRLFSEAQADERDMSDLRKEWRNRSMEEFYCIQETACPSCGQALPEEKINAAREKALSDFNLAKAQDLELISAAGKRSKENHEKLMAEHAELAEKTVMLESQLANAKAEVHQLQISLDALIGQGTSILDNPVFAAALGRKGDLEAEIANLQADNRGATARAIEEKQELEKQIRQLNTEQASIKARESGLNRIEQLKAQEKRLAAEYEKLEGELYLCDSFVKAKVNLLESRINSRFRHARFKLFEQQVNGGITETCVTLYKGVPYPDLNGAAKINIGLDVIETLADHYGFHAPIFVDERESVSELFPVSSQVVSLVVSPADKVLRVEYVQLKEAVNQ